jgi:hypothetical protein
MCLYNSIEGYVDGKTLTGLLVTACLGNLGEGWSLPWRNHHGMICLLLIAEYVSFTIKPLFIWRCNVMEQVG